MWEHQSLATLRASTACTFEVHYCVQNISPQVFTPSQMMLILHPHILFYMTHFNIILPSTSKYYKWCLSFRFSYKIFLQVYISLISHAFYMRILILCGISLVKLVKYKCSFNWNKMFLLPESSLFR
jgi:hypothetical protein